jgi:hypothetical protein
VIEPLLHAQLSELGSWEMGVDRRAVRFWSEREFSRPAATSWRPCGC